MSTQGMRKAAAVLASLHPRDQAWMLGHLRPTWRYDLKRLMREASRLGMGGRAHLDDVLQACERPQAHIEPPAPDRLLAGLRGLSPEWTARTLIACAPDHLELYAASEEPAQVREVRQELLNLPRSLPPKLAETLTRLVRERGERALNAVGAR